MPSFIDQQQSLSKERRFQEELMRSKKGMADQIQAKRINVSAAGKVDPSGGQIASAQPQEISGATGMDAAQASQIKSAGAGMAGNAAGNMIDGGGTTTSTSSGAAGGAMKGAASMAATGNPYLIGGAAIMGGITGGMKAKKARKAKAAEIEATHQANLGKIEGQKTQRLGEAMAGLSAQFGRTLNNNQTLGL